MKEFIKSIPILSGLLIFIGYFNYLTFFRAFDIDISTYLSTSELILSFLPLTFPILVLIGLFAFHSIGAIVILSYRKRKNREDNYDNFNIYAFKAVLFRIIKNFRKKKYKKWNILWLLLDVFSLIFTSVLILFFILYIFFLIKMIFSNPDKMNIPSMFMVILAFFWVFLFLDIVNRAASYKNISSPYYIKIFFLSALFLGLIVIYNKENANKIMSGKPQFEIKLITERNDTIITNSNLVFIGKTSNYLFLRNRNEKENIIYRLENVSELTMKKKN